MKMVLPILISGFFLVISGSSKAVLPEEDRVAVTLEKVVPKEADAETIADLLKSSNYTQDQVVPFSRRYRQQLFGILNGYPKAIRSIAKENVRIVILSRVGYRAKYVQPNSSKDTLVSRLPVIILNEKLFTDPSYFNPSQRLRLNLSPSEAFGYQWVSNVLPEDAGLAFTYLHELSRHLWLSDFSLGEREKFSQFSWDNGVPKEEGIKEIKDIADLCKSYKNLSDSSFVSLDSIENVAEDAAEHMALVIWTQIMKKDWLVTLPAVCGTSTFDPFVDLRSGECEGNCKRAVFSEKTEWVKSWLSDWSQKKGLNMMTETRGNNPRFEGGPFWPWAIRSIKTVRERLGSLRWDPKQDCLDGKLKLAFMEAIKQVVTDQTRLPRALEIGGEGFYHGHILFDVQAYTTVGGRSRYTEIEEYIKILLKSSANKNVDVINYLVNQPETIILFHSREGRLYNTNLLTTVAGVYPSQIVEMKEALNRHSFTISPTTGQFKALETQNFVEAPEKTSLYEYTQLEMEDLVNSGMWYYNYPPKTEISSLSGVSSENSTPKIAGYFYPEIWSIHHALYFTISSDDSVSVQGVSECNNSVPIP